ncbi:hypothetical protein [Synechococcus sp. PCC 7335]|uniref:hypothetical protein n=1 Tax=Synechococcus sp. (strain ATCC 29403 / PCC 7335) TaxID=91464 RepID=UPI0018DC2393|nr:hypothetical protein [Synechococcus sp. PCC 7335]
MITIRKKQMTFSQQLALAEKRAKETGDFLERWHFVTKVLADEYAISRKADGTACLYYFKWISTKDGGASLETVPIFECIEHSASTLGMEMFCDVLSAYGLHRSVAIRLYRVCVPFVVED